MFGHRQLFKVVTSREMTALCDNLHMQCTLYDAEAYNQQFVNLLTQQWVFCFAVFVVFLSPGADHMILMYAYVCTT